jgi:flagellin-like protein
MTGKGISPIIATVLLVAFTVSVAMIVMGWFTTYVRTTSENVTGGTSSALACSSGIIQIERIYVISTVGGNYGNATVIAKNIGQISLNVSAMLVAANGTFCRTSSGGVIAAGASGAINISGCTNLTNAANFSSAMLTTNCAGVYDSTTSSSKVTFS